MKVLHAINSLGAGGAERLLCALAPLQRAAGCEVRILALSRAEHELQGESIESVDSPTPYSRRSYGALAHAIRDWRPDIVHAHLFPTQLYAAFCRHASSALVTTEHNTFNRRRAKRYLRPLDRMMYARYDAVASISEATRAALEAWCPIRGVHAVIPNGIRLPALRSAARTFPPAGQRPWRLLCVARLETQKGIDVLLRALALVPNAHLRIAGDGALSHELQHLARWLAVAHRVEFLGYRDDVAALMQDADAYVQPSRWEGFGIAAVEAMAAGLPVVHSDVPGLREVVAEAGIAFANEGAQSLADALGALMDSPALYERLSAAGPDRAARYSIARTAQAYGELYARVAR